MVCLKFSQSYSIFLRWKPFSTSSLFLSRPWRNIRTLLAERSATCQYFMSDCSFSTLFSTQQDLDQANRIEVCRFSLFFLADLSSTRLCRFDQQYVLQPSLESLNPSLYDENLSYVRSFLASPRMNLNKSRCRWAYWTSLDVWLHTIIIQFIHTKDILVSLANCNCVQVSLKIA